MRPGHPRSGRCPGPEAAWALYKRLTALNISAALVDQAGSLATLADGETTANPIDLLPAFSTVTV
ncbi:hypothetical protein BGV66_12305 [Burkholderia ubonensis]|uniref:Uncharacterized protein n=1 Tax=Burkholderia ubonensis TaxID=101571 RepID=A0ABD6Q4R4_9BURK|nr:hypothetical protein BGV66_12305 [Burkholderia ubonensis]